MSFDQVKLEIGYFTNGIKQIPAKEWILHIY